MTEADELRPLAGRHALVTGASRGIGASAAAHLARLGARVTLLARSGGELAKVAQAASELGSEALPVTCDLADWEQLERAFVAGREAFGPVDVLVNNAALLVQGPFVELTREDWERVSALNLGAALRAAQLALADMLAAERGVIVNVASVAGVSGIPTLPGLVAYAATKGGLIAMSESLAEEVKGAGVRVVALSPGSVRTRMLEEAAPEHMDSAMTPGQVGRVIARLACDESGALRGGNIVLG